MKQSVIELHDSIVSAIDLHEEAVVIVFSHAYVHISNGVPGRDPGSGWSKGAELTIRNANTDNLPRGWPCEIYSGCLQVGDKEYENEIPIPLSTQDKTCLRMKVCCPDGDYYSVEIRGLGAQLTLLGEPRYVEEFPGSRGC